MIFQYRKPIFSSVAGEPYDSATAAQTAVNVFLSDNPGYCLIHLTDGPMTGTVLDEDWSVKNPIHEIVLVEMSDTDPVGGLTTALSSNPGYHFVTDWLVVTSTGILGAFYVLGRS